MFSFIAGLLLIFHVSLIFAITLFSAVIFFRTRDHAVGGSIRILLPSFLFTLIYLIHHLAGLQPEMLAGDTAENLSLYLLITVCITLALFIHSVADHLAAQLALSQARRRAASVITNLLVLFFLLFSIFFLILLNRESWKEALKIALTDMFLYSSILLLIPAGAAAIHLLPRFRKVGRSRPFADLVIAFSPSLITLPIDLTLLRSSPFKLTFITHSLLAVTIFLHLMRHYLINYEADPDAIRDLTGKFFSAHEISQREQEIFLKMIEGRTNREIGADLFISPNTVKTHISNIYKKTGVSNRIQLVHRIKNLSP